MTSELFGGNDGDEGTQSTLKTDNMDVKKTGEYKCVACNTGNCTAQVINVFIDGKYWELVFITCFLQST